MNVNGRESGNGSRLILWLVGLIFPFTAGGIAHVLTKVNAQAEDVAVLKYQQAETAAHLRAIEQKLDRIIERGK